jgi:hypothetical protein
MEGNRGRVGVNPLILNTSIYVTVTIRIMKEYFTKLPCHGLVFHTLMVPGEK